MSFVGSSNRRRQRNPPEYRLYARVSDASTTVATTMSPLTEADRIDESDCLYQTIWMPPVKEHMKAALLLCQEGSNVEIGWMNRHDDMSKTMMFIPGEDDLSFYYYDQNNKWIEYGEKLRLLEYQQVNWNRDVLFTTARGKAIQMKVEDARESAEQYTRPAIRPRAPVPSNGAMGMPTPSLHMLADMRMHLSDR